MQKIALTLAIAATSAEATWRLPASSLCFENFTTVEISWLLADEYFMADSPWATTASAETSCEDIATFAVRVQEGQNFNPYAIDVPSYDHPALGQYYHAEPFLTYQADGP